MESAIKKRSLVVAGRRTSISLEAEFFDCLKEIAGTRGTTVANLVAEIAEHSGPANLSSAIRTFVLEHYRLVHVSTDDMRLTAS